MGKVAHKRYRRCIMAEEKKLNSMLTKILDVIKGICVTIALPFVKFFRRLVR